MKKKIFAVMFITAVVIFAGYNANLLQSNVNSSNLALANVEALAECEYSGYDTVTEDTTLIRDDKTGTYHKVVVKICDGCGCLDC